MAEKAEWKHRDPPRRGCDVFREWHMKGPEPPQGSLDAGALHGMAMSQSDGVAPKASGS